MDFQVSSQEVEGNSMPKPKEIVIELPVIQANVKITIKISSPFFALRFLRHWSAVYNPPLYLIKMTSNFVLEKKVPKPYQ